jgi:hypothetical protein
MGMRLQDHLSDSFQSSNQQLKDKKRKASALENDQDNLRGSVFGPL